MSRKFKNLIKELEIIKKQLNEDFIFNGEEGMMDDGMYDDNEMYDEEMPQQEPPMEQKPSIEGDSEEEVAMHAHEVIKHEPIIGKIRETAIEGLKKYADHPTSSLYEFFKKVFLESDKVLTDTGKK